jgi:hypothetical protein
VLGAALLMLGTRILDWDHEMLQNHRCHLNYFTPLPTATCRFQIKNTINGHFQSIEDSF